MAQVRTTLTIDQDVLKSVKIRAARTGLSDSAVIEESPLTAPS
jgi:Ribbon-helix-helix protein, copG family